MEQTKNLCMFTVALLEADSLTGDHMPSLKSYFILILTNFLVWLTVDTLGFVEFFDCETSFTNENKAFLKITEVIIGKSIEIIRI